MALTATATAHTRKPICKLLGMTDPVIVAESATKANIEYLVNAILIHCINQILNVNTKILRYFQDNLGRDICLTSGRSTSIGLLYFADHMIVVHTCTRTWRVDLVKSSMNPVAHLVGLGFGSLTCSQLVHVLMSKMTHWSCSVYQSLLLEFCHCYSSGYRLSEHLKSDPLETIWEHWTLSSRNRTCRTRR